MILSVHVPGPTRCHGLSTPEKGQDSYAGSQRTSQDPKQNVTQLIAHIMEINCVQTHALTVSGTVSLSLNYHKKTSQI